MPEQTKKSHAPWQVLEYFVPFSLTPLKEGMQDNGDVFINGVAISETTTRNNHKYIAEELEKAAEGLIGRPLLVDHRNEVDAIKGKVVDARFDPQDRNIKFSAQIMDPTIKQMIRDGRLSSVSVGCFCKDLVKDETSEAYIAKGLEFAELSLVAVPADVNASFDMSMAKAMQVKESFMSKEMMKCKECGKMVDKDKMKDHMKKHEEDMEESHSKFERRYGEMTEQKESEALQLKEAFEAQAKELAQLKSERKAHLVSEYKKLCAEKKVNAKDVSNLDESTIKLLMEQVSEITVSVAELKSVKTEESKSVAAGMDNLVVEHTGNGKVAFWAMPDRNGRISLSI